MRTGQRLDPVAQPLLFLLVRASLTYYQRSQMILFRNSVDNQRMFFLKINEFE